MDTIYVKAAATPTPAPTSAPTGAPTGAPTYSCQTWCASNANDWSTLCTWCATSSQGHSQGQAGKRKQYRDIHGRFRDGLESPIGRLGNESIIAPKDQSMINEPSMYSYLHKERAGYDLGKCTIRLRIWRCCSCSSIYVNTCLSLHRTHGSPLDS